jgi:pantoate--beta-alanine ligase
VVLEGAGIEVEYLEAVDPETFRPASSLEGEVLVAVAARVGSVRLIDNVLVPAEVSVHVEATEGYECNA